MSRREGEDLEHKSGLRPIEEKCRLKNRPGNPPKNIRSKTSDYLNHLRAKQKMRRYYCVLERQFRNYYRKAANAKGDTGVNLVHMLECRLDNIVCRIGFARTRNEARQIVSHKQVLVDGKIVNVPSYQVAIGQVISLKEKARQQQRISDAIDLSYRRQNDFPWLETDTTERTGRLTKAPDRTSLGISFDEGMVIEYYSK